MSLCYDLVPKDLPGNLRFRASVEEWAAGSIKRQAYLKEVCRNDLLFWVNAFVWTYDPRLDHHWNKSPFITYPYQDVAFGALEDGYGKRDFAIRKSRDTGASTVVLTFIAHRIDFLKRQTIMAVSRKEDLVDKTEDPDSLFWKIDFIHENLPEWLRPAGVCPNEAGRNHLLIYNKDTRSSVVGGSTTADIGRGGRRTMIYIDEFAAFGVQDSYAVQSSTQFNSRCRVYTSTPKGVGNGFYDLFHGKHPVRSQTFRWSDHPVQNRGLYCWKEGEGVELLDPGFWDVATVGGMRDRHDRLKLDESLPDDALVRDHYPFERDGKLRSPYYDQECARLGLRTLIAQELDVDFVGSGSPVFKPEEVERLLREGVKPALVVGELQVCDQSFQPIEFQAMGEGRTSLWCHLQGPQPPVGEYIAAADVSAGTEATPSCLSVGRVRHGEVDKVLSFATASLGPGAFAEQAVAICRWFFNAKLIWEGQGPGEQFTRRVMELGYHRTYSHEEEDPRVRKRRTTTVLTVTRRKIPG